MQLIDHVFLQLNPWINKKHWWVGFSGGMDSTVLLHMLATLKATHTLPKISAIYIHHGLQTAAEGWPEHCQKICDQLSIPLYIIKVSVAQEASIEQAARNARYQAFSEVLKEDEVLLTAQHQNDQAETLLFRLFRGSGLKGLTAIPFCRKLNNADLVRPLLNTSHKALEHYAMDHQLSWITDPSNNDLNYSRNYIRHSVLPIIQKKWPHVISNIAQATTHLQEAQQLLEELAEQNLRHCQGEDLYPWLTIPHLSINRLCELSWAKQKNLLSFWLATHHILAPSTTHWKGLQDLLSATTSSYAIWQLQNAVLHRYHDQMWLLQHHWLIKPSLNEPIIIKNEVTSLPNNGQVMLSGEVPPTPLFVSYRQGGECLPLTNRGTRDLKRLFNESNIPTFLRDRLPLLINQHHGVIAVANFPQWRHKNYPQSFQFDWII